MNDTRKHILTTLAYFDIFHYPLHGEEIHRFHGQPASRAETDEELRSLTEEHTICFIDGFYLLNNDGGLVIKRKEANRLAARQMVIACKSARLLSRFPYVKGIAISGSLSKNYADEKADIDFFIITTANRLWIARTLMHLFKKLTYLSGRQNRYCMNYYVDEEAPVIEEKNIFTAIEISTLIPMHGKRSLDDFVIANSWVNQYFPLCRMDTDNTPGIKKGFLSAMIERLFNAGLGNRLDKWLMAITERRWKRKELRNLKNSKGNPLGMIVSRHCSKPNPKNFQDKVVSKFRQKIDALLLPPKKMSRAG